MSVTLPGLGVATPIADLLTNYRRLVRDLPAVIDQHPTARVVRNRVGNLTIVVEAEDGILGDWGWIDVRTGDIELRDEPWPVAPSPACPRCGGPTGRVRDVCKPCEAALGWDPPCGACHTEQSGKVAEVSHVDTCTEGTRRIR